MKINQETVIIGKRVILVPYLLEHVPTYHTWMCDEELRTLTASEPLTLEEEFEMQQKWRLDDDKLTFIILARDGATSLSQDEVVSPSDPRVTSLPMIGDVNMFFKGHAPDLGDHLQWRQSESDDGDFEAEVEIMIAEHAYRRKGCASEALQLMLIYATGAPHTYFNGAAAPRGGGGVASSLKVPPAALITRISESNIPSVRLFETLGFRVTKRVEVFCEVEMRWFRKE